MEAKELRAVQAPIKERYRKNPEAAARTFEARGILAKENLTVQIESEHRRIVSGLHEAAGGDGSHACSGDMLLEALVACAGVTLKAVATAMRIVIRQGTITAEGDADFRGTLGVDAEVPVGITDIRIHFELDTDASPEKLTKMLELTERYCMVYQTLKSPPSLSMSHCAK